MPLPHTHLLLSFNFVAAARLFECSYAIAKMKCASRRAAKTGTTSGSSTALSTRIRILNRLALLSAAPLLTGGGAEMF
jgi:hypothetical protein